MEFAPIINDELALFLYIPNILNQNELIELTSWPENLQYKKGKCISGKDIPKNKYGFRNMVNIFVKIGKLNMTVGKRKLMMKYYQNISIKLII